MGQDDRPAVLIGEDDPEILLLLELQLRRAGFHSTSATSGTDVLRLALAGTVDLVVLDLALPHIDGLSILEQIRASSTTAGLPVVVVSADARESRARDCLERGASAYITKPFRFEALLEAVNQALGR